jgi:glutamine amidotransferase
MGWNVVKGSCRLLGDPEAFYFTHSYVAPQGTWVRAETGYSIQIPAVVELRNFAGVQFHPEKSGPVGARLLERFLSW